MTPRRFLAPVVLGLGIGAGTFLTPQDGLGPPAGTDATPAGLASPAATPVAACLHPPLRPPATPTPIPATPAATPVEVATPLPTPATPQPDEATPVPEPPPEPDPTLGERADRATSRRLHDSVQWAEACLAGGDVLAYAAFFTENGLAANFGTYDPYQVPEIVAEAGGYPPLDVETVRQVRILPDERVGAVETYLLGPQRLRDLTYFVDAGSFFLRDAAYELPVEASEEAAIAAAELTDGAIRVDPTAIGWAEEVGFRVTNASESGTGHVALLVGCEAGTSAEALVSGETDAAAACGAFYGALYVEPGEERDLVFVGLPPGTYFLLCDLEAPDGLPYYRHGMVAEVQIAAPAATPAAAPASTPGATPVAGD